MFDLDLSLIDLVSPYPKEPNYLLKLKMFYNLSCVKLICLINYLMLEVNGVIAINTLCAELLRSCSSYGRWSAEQG